MYNTPQIEYPLQNKLNKIEYKLQLLDKKVESLDEKVELLIRSVHDIKGILEDNIEPNCEKMNKHINFIDGVYESVKYTMEYISNKINNTNPSIKG